MNSRFFRYSVVVVFIAGLLCSAACSASVKQYKVRVVKDYPHDDEAYTQGLFFDDEAGRFCESTGQFGKSSFRLVDLESGKVLRKLSFNDKYFAEGSVMLGGKLYILTWTNRVAFVYDAETLEYEKTYSYPRAGWGLTTDGKSLIASDGSSSLYFMDGKFSVLKTLKVTLNGRPINNLNELEWIEGKIWANVYLTDMILIINPESGKVEATIDCSGLLPKSLKTPDTDVLNGIAYDKKNKKTYLTGKNWSRLYEIKLVEDK